MQKVIFVSGFKFITSGTEVTLTSTGITVTNGCRSAVSLTLKEIDALVALGFVRIVDVPDRTPFAPKAGVSLGKINQAIADDKNKYFLGEDYEFYNVEKNEFVTSTLLNTASHIGRIAAGFAVPAGSTDTKKFNRLTKLNEVYSLGLSKAQITSATR